MAVRRIMYLGEPILREVAKPVAAFDAGLAALAEDMIETMLEAPGLGLSAPQVGAGIRLIVVRVPRPDAETDAEEETAEGGGAKVDQHRDADEAQATDEKDEAQSQEEVTVFVLANPEIVELGEETVTRVEGCLSLPTLHGLVTRPERVMVRGSTLEGQNVELEACGLLARVFQHEIDHLNGVLFIDRAEAESLYWLVPDEEEETGYREEPTTVEEVVERFERLRQRRLSREARASS
ncbi:MAG: peptide deformylase [Armatimonadetes bacterium]|nr:peptide deformylase [Armatimonadota bacterium]